VRKQLRPSQVLGFFCWVVAVCDRNGGVCEGELLSPRVDSAWLRRASDAAELCGGLRQAQHERCGRCGSNLRSGEASGDALRAGEDSGSASILMIHRAKALIVRQPYDAGERVARTYGGVRHRWRKGIAQDGGTYGDCQDRQQ